MKNKVRYVRGIRVVRNGAGRNEMAVKANGVAQLHLRMTPVLVPKEYQAPPADGIYELDFTLDETVGDITQLEIEVEVIFHVKNMPEWVKGVRINASENSDIELL
jgi:hypothetical protein